MCLPRAVPRVKSSWKGMPWLAIARCLLLLIVGWHFVVNVTHQGYPHLRCVVATEDIADKMRLHLHVYLICISTWDLIHPRGLV